LLVTDSIGNSNVAGRQARKILTALSIASLAIPAQARAGLNRRRSHVITDIGSASLFVEAGRCCMSGRETASGRMEKSALWVPVAKQKVSLVER
jgi:hypothetical protein